VVGRAAKLETCCIGAHTILNRPLREEMLLESGPTNVVRAALWTTDGEIPVGTEQVGRGASKVCLECCARSAARLPPSRDDPHFGCSRRGNWVLEEVCECVFCQPEFISAQGVEWLSPGRLPTASALDVT
jgi:hypothetical protein